MSKPLDLQQERFSPTGNIASEGMRNQLGRPRLDRLAVLMREAAQNAWDAKADDFASVTFGVTSYSLTPEQFRVLSKVVFHKRPPPEAAVGDDARTIGRMMTDGDRWLEQEGDPRFRVLAIHDRGTTGLGGPTRADDMSPETEARDFVDFLRNIGQPPDKDRGGGTFGYGKAALYLSGEAQTILVHTRCHFRGKLQSRFMVSGLTNHYSSKGARYTGRHWWGRVAKDNVVEPILDAEADSLAESLGLPGFAGRARGTTILILGPRFDERTPEQAVRYMVGQLVWNFWPKMVPWPGEAFPRMRFSASIDGTEMRVPDPSSLPPLAGFVDALRAVRAVDRGLSNNDAGVTVAKLECKSPKKQLGLLGLVKFPREPRRWGDLGADASLPGFDERSHHVALMRRAELVVNYHPGPAIPNDHIEYAGVFVCDDEMDRVYASSEPPTHDEWRPENLADRQQRKFVNVTFTRLDEQLHSLATPPETEHETVVGEPLAALAAHVGRLLIFSPAATDTPRTTEASRWVSVSSEERVDRRAGTASGARLRGRAAARPTVEVDEQPELRLENGKVFRVYSIRIKLPAGTSEQGADLIVTPISAFAAPAWA